MPAPRNLLKEKLIAGQTQIGCWLDMAANVPAEIAGRAGFDWCMIDGEHAPLNPTLIRDQLIALQAVGCAAAVRVPMGEAWYLKQVLDAGAQSVLVPMVDSAAEARAMVQAVKYPPQGGRGLAALVIRASGYGAEADYTQTANDQICLMVQAETPGAVEHIDAIAATEGVDCVFIGPHDLAANMGYVGNTDAAEVRAAIAHVMARTRAAGKAVGMFCLNPDDLAGYRDMGATVLAVASDVVSYRQALEERIRKVRSVLK
ncbi:2,4-dihydroxyhept-2-ene-1,7-dioic acid aldolase [Candidatus Rhodobacter oscarellae]|uniref:2,4-dihydroxyhept-2-ene-1,7-dioic acid aldolase n=1 Tax=Candidatus Rhodobacter oscarellae TaxID=1675527 RepID=A0A0J9E6B6_9RHOB|nr:HpcH/HpaI aldolase/citrate lyase family protein [Candidatus Rhodobacter lobularis]KMW57374.1 2,4-dihydroxyhept-2-ene-1,7-dioic acid aldolase [Candidatus Rhodobacter lobularis]